jgi:hypothetical protein
MALILAKQVLSGHCGQENRWGSNCQLLPAFWVKRGSLLDQAELARHGRFLTDTYMLLYRDRGPPAAAYCFWWEFTSSVSPHSPESEMT